MKNLGPGVLFLMLLCGGAQAAEFLVLDTGAGLTIPALVMTDSSSIKPGETGHKLARLLYVHEAGEWDERDMELDCGLARWRELDGGRHHMDGSVSAETADDGWTALQDGSPELRVRETVCAWPEKKPTDDRIITGDLQPIIDRASVLVSRMVDTTQQERDNDK